MTTKEVNVLFVSSRVTKDLFISTCSRWGYFALSPTLIHQKVVGRYGEIRLLSLEWTLVLSWPRTSTYGHTFNWPCRFFRATSSLIFPITVPPPIDEFKPKDQFFYSDDCSSGVLDDLPSSYGLGPFWVKIRYPHYPPIPMIMVLSRVYLLYNYLRSQRG
jgi:hypothetical protein